MKRVIDYETIIKDGQKLKRPIYEIHPPIPLSEPLIPLEDIPPLDAKGNIWHKKER